MQHIKRDDSLDLIAGNDWPSNTTVATTSFPVIHGDTKFRARSQRGSYFTTNVKCTTATLMGMALGYVHRRNCYGKQIKDAAHQECTCSYRARTREPVINFVCQP